MRELQTRSSSALFVPDASLVAAPARTLRHRVEARAVQSTAAPVSVHPPLHPHAQLIYIALKEASALYLQSLS
eukprot:1645032-Pleurochrysis_carterae.AAC.5